MPAFLGGVPTPSPNILPTWGSCSHRPGSSGPISNPEDMERLENKDGIAERLGLDPNEKSEPKPQQVSPESASQS